MRAQLRRVEAGLVEISLVNDGELDISSRLAVEIRWQDGRLVAGDGLRGFELVEGEASTARLTTRTHPGPFVRRRKANHWLAAVQQKTLRCNLKSRRNGSAVGGLILSWFVLSQNFRLLACGPEFPNQMLDRGDEAVLAAPIACFDRELERIHLLPASFQAVLASNDYAGQTLDAELADLGAALRKTHAPKLARDGVLTSYGAERAKLAHLHVAANPDSGANGSADRSGPVPIENLFVPAGVPEEFADYFRGSIAWHAGQDQ